MIEETVPPGDRISIVGFSMGGLVARSYVQDFGGVRRVAQLLTIGTPNQGTETARLLLMPGIREMVPGSVWLQRLNRGSFNQLRRIRYGVIWSTTDGVVFPSASSQIPGAWERRLSGVFHAGLSSDPRTIQGTAEFLGSPR
jgi:triacylglycerol lipase